MRTGLLKKHLKLLVLAEEYKRQHSLSDASIESSYGDHLDRVQIFQLEGTDELICPSGSVQAAIEL